jgi:hypothetical protein
LWLAHIAFAVSKLGLHPPFQRRFSCMRPYARGYPTVCAKVTNCSSGSFMARASFA